MLGLNLPTLQVGDALPWGGFQLFPLFSPEDAEVGYRLPAQGAEEATITEVNQAGAVPCRVVENHSDSLLLLVEGQELLGAKQNRVLNTAYPARVALTASAAETVLAKTPAKKIPKPRRTSKVLIVFPSFTGIPHPSAASKYFSEEQVLDQIGWPSCNQPALYPNTINFQGFAANWNRELMID